MPRPQDDPGEGIDYRSNTETPEADRVSTADEEDFSTLKQLVSIVNDAKAKCASINLIDTESKMSAEQQALAFQFCLNELVLPFELSVKDAIGEVKMKQRGIK